MKEGANLLAGPENLCTFFFNQTKEIFNLLREDQNLGALSLRCLPCYKRNQKGKAQ